MQRKRTPEEEAICRRIRERQKADAKAALARATQEAVVPHPGGEPVPVTITYRPDGAARVQRHAARRLPLSHPDAHLIDRMAAAGQLHDRHYANAVALWQLWRLAGLDPRGTGRYQPAARGSADGGPCYLTRYTREMRALPDPQAWALGLLVRGQHPGQRLPDALAGLDRLDHLTAEFAADMWAEEGA